jgi:Flp pilus assembly protein TadG
MRWRTRKNGRTERGASALEFALTVPFLLLLLGGVINIGFAFAEQLALDNAAREGARFAVVDHGGACGAVEAYTLDQLALATSATFALTGETGTCDRPCDNAIATTDLTVTLTYTAEPLITLPLPTFGWPGFGDITMKGEGVFRCEYS